MHWNDNQQVHSYSEILLKKKKKKKKAGRGSFSHGFAANAGPPHSHHSHHCFLFDVSSQSRICSHAVNSLSFQLSSCLEQ